MSLFVDWIFQGQDWLSSFGYWTLPMYMVIYFLLTLVGMPAIFLYLAAGSMFGFVKGFVVVSFTDTLSTSACYMLGRTIGRPMIRKWIAKRPRFAQLDHAVAIKGWKIVLLTRLSPILPSSLLNYSFSLTRIDFWQYLFFSWLGMLPVIGLYVYLGSVGVNLATGNNNPRQITLTIFGLLLAGVAFVYSARLTKQHLSPTKNSRK
ncbi:SNARE associated Golgi family protein [Hyella patelloides LEGE 07179]|uniref:TVP38/TMEM64 family membrane protein n=1 Tax=Hyella patelloides LEGE 07179 TaxID=945734 RepID=A0A563VML7_9CYAN|nr:TVP38/TMEM64 family protein [Hyella patelloides]VEP12583.1 SNARE associated Golgi family protein [Hyella patelloides LEGE 07179]